MVTSIGEAKAGTLVIGGENGMMAAIACALALGLVTAGAEVAWAEYRAALLISNTAYKEKADIDAPDVTGLQKALEKSGFRCQVHKDLTNEYAFRDAIESFASRTPTRGTALVYFFGHVETDQNP